MNPVHPPITARESQGASTGVPDEIVDAIKSLAAETGVSPGEVIARLYELYTELRVTTEPTVLHARSYSQLP